MCFGTKDSRAGKNPGKILRIVTWGRYYAPMPQNGVHINGAAIKNRRRSLLLTQEKAAADADIHPSTLQSMEADEAYRASFKTIRKVARVLNCEPTELVRQVEEVAS